MGIFWGQAGSCADPHLVASPAVRGVPGGGIQRQSCGQAALSAPSPPQDGETRGGGNNWPCCHAWIPLHPETWKMITPPHPTNASMEGQLAQTPKRVTVRQALGWTTAVEERSGVTSDTRDGKGDEFIHGSTCPFPAVHAVDRCRSCGCLLCHLR